MGLFGDLVIDAMGGFPTIPDAPAAPNVNPQAAQRESIAGNRAVLPELEALAGDVNQFNVGQRQSMLRQGIPGYEKLTGGASDLLTGWLGGQLSPDVASAVRRSANARAVAGGYGGGGGSPLYGPSMKDTLTWRDLGLAADTGQQRAMSLLNPFLATVGGLGVPKLYDPAGEFINPMQQVAAQQWNESNRYGRDWLQAQLESIPDPATAAIAKDVGGMADAIGSMIPYFGAFYGMSQGGAGGGTGGGMRDIGMGGGGGGSIGGGWLDSLFGGGGGGAMGGGAGAMGNIGGIGLSGMGF